MYESIYRYAREHNLSPVRNRAMRICAAYICINEEGVYDRLDVVPKDNRIKRWYPDIGNKASSGTNTNIICNKKEYIFCVSDGQGGATGNTAKHTGWLEITQEGAVHSGTMESIWKFCQKIETDRNLYDQIEKELLEAGIKNTDFISFRINGNRAEECHDWEEWFDRKMNLLDSEKRKNVETGISLITGESIVPIQGDEKFPKIKTPQTTTGSPIYSCIHKTVSGNLCAFTSYGVVNSLGSPMSVDEAEAIKAGLEYLLMSPKNHSDQFNIIYWYDNDNVDDLIELSIKGSFEDDEDDEGDVDQSSVKETAYSRLLDAVRKGTVPDMVEGQGNYHIVHYEVPAKGRFYLNGERTGRYSELYQNLFYWYGDSSITYNNRKRVLSNLYGVLFGLLEHKNSKDKFKEIKNEYGTDRSRLLEAIHENRQIPEKFFEKALKQTIRVYLHNLQTDDGKEIIKEVNWPVPMQVIKVYLTRNGKESYRMDALDLESTSTAYNCGRLLAAIDRLQRVSAESKVNLTIGQKYFKSASKTPGKVMTMALANEGNYLKRVKNEGTKIYYIRLLGELSEKVGASIPEKFSRTEQGEFMLGYFYQQKEFVKKSDNNENNNDNENNNNNSEED